MVASPPGVRCRQIEESDLGTVAALLARGFPHHGHNFWQRALARLARHRAPAGLPKYGYLLEARGSVVGAILLICAAVPSGSATTKRCNLSSWYVDPSFRTYAPLLVSRALKHKDVTFLNVSPAPHTLPIIEAQGFARYCEGIFVAFPWLNGMSGAAKVRVLDVASQPFPDADSFEREILARHAELGCISLWCVTPDGAAFPFVFRPRLVRHLVPCAQLIYCRDIADFVRFAGPIGRYLARRGKAVVIIDANGPIPGLVGTFRAGSMPKYFKGPQRPRLGDLAYTEYGVLGV